MYSEPPKNKRLDEPGFKREKQKVADEKWQSERMFSKRLPSRFVSRKQRIAGWNYIFDKLVLLMLMIALPFAVMVVEVSVFNYLFQWLGFDTINFIGFK